LAYNIWVYVFSGHFLTDNHSKGFEIEKKCEKCCLIGVGIEF